MCVHTYLKRDCLNMKYDMFIYTFKNWRNYVHATDPYQFTIIFFLEHTGEKYKQKLCISAYFGHYLGKIQLVPKEKRNSGWICYFESTQAVQICSKFILKCFIPKIVPNGTILVEYG